MAPILGPEAISDSLQLSHETAKFHSIDKVQKSPFQLTKESKIEDYLNQNRIWAERQNALHPSLFELNGAGQAPHTLWIGCSDSRYNENCLNVSPGEVFGFQCIANLMNANELTTLSTLEFSINYLKVKKIIMCGHTDCGGVLNSILHKNLGDSNCHLVKYLSKLDEIRDKHEEKLSAIGELDDKVKRLAEINVIEQIKYLKQQQIVIDALNDRKIEIWGMIYNVSSGKLEVVSTEL